MSKRSLASRLMRFRPLNLLVRAVPVWRGLLVLNYHRIGSRSEADFDRGVWSATAEDLEWQLGYVRDHFQVIGPYDIADALGGKPDRYVLLTFDDGYLDNYEVAFPLLKSFGFPGAFFLCTGFIDTPRVAWWDEIAWMIRRSPRDRLPRSRWLADISFDEPDREAAVTQVLRAYKALHWETTTPFLDSLGEATGTGRCDPDVARNQWITWDMAREMRAAGMSFGGHTVNHPVMALLSPEQQSAEVAACKARIELELGEPMRLFSYPVGSKLAFDDVTRACLREHGVEQAFSFYGGYQPMGAFDSLDIPRAIITSHVSLPIFQAITTVPQVFSRW